MTITFTGKIAATGLTGYQQETGNPAGFTVVPDPLGEAGSVLRAHMAFGDALAAGSYRSEINIDPIRTAVGAMGWYWARVQLPATWQVGGNPVTVFQVHDTPDGGDPVRRPPFELAVDGDMLEFVSSAAISGVNDNQVNRIVWARPLTQYLGRWVDFVMQVTWNYTSGGALKVWLDRRCVFVESGQKNCYNDVAGLYPKLGVYCPLNLSLAIPERTVYHQGLVVGDNAYSTFDGFMSAASIAQTELETVGFRGSVS